MRRHYNMSRGRCEYGRLWIILYGMITQELEDNIKFTRTDARRRRLGAVTVEHLVLVLIDNSSVRRCLSACNADIQSLRQDLEHFIESQIPSATSAEPAPTAEFKRVLRRAVEQEGGRNRTSGAHVLAAVFAEPNSRAAYYLGKHGVERLAILAHAGGRLAESPESDSRTDDDWVAMAAAGRLETPFGRADEVAEITRILSRKYKNNPLLVGEPGVGKTAVVRQLAHLAANKNAPPILAEFSLHAVSVGDLVAGTKYRGDFEQRIRQLLDKCRARPNAALFIDEIHTLVGAGAVSGGNLDAANIMKPLLDGGIRCIGATTFTEYRRIFEKDAALARRFHKIDIHEPGGEELDAILSGVVTRLSAHHHVPYDPASKAAAITYSRRFLPSRFLPVKAVDWLDDAGARNRAAQSLSPVVAEDVAEVAADMAGVAADIVRDENRLGDLAAQLSTHVIAQDEAASQLAAAVLRRRLGYHDHAQTAGSFLFAGPTGAGKTEMAKQLAQALGAALLRFDMSEYMESHSVSRLIGAPPGYVGHDLGGKLTEEIARHPGAVVLLDEIEKAHPEVRNIFLQIMDYGALTDNTGRRADFTNAILIMTSNVGAESWERPPPGFARRDAEQAGDEELSRRFSPEFRNRLDAIIRFRPLSADALSRVLRLSLNQLAARLRADKNISVRFGRRLRAACLADGFSPSMGARPLRRLLRERIIDPLAAAESEGKIVSGGKYVIENSEDGNPVVRSLQ